MAAVWPRRPTYWIVNRVLHVSIPFTWGLESVRRVLCQRDLLWDRVVVGGPAVYLMPGYFNRLNFVAIGRNCPEALQRVNPLSTKTTSGCVRRCAFCAVPVIEGSFLEFDDWPDLPILADNNLLAASQAHFDRVVDRLVKWGWADFNQGLDSRLLTDHHAQRFKQIKQPIIRLALDHMASADQWELALERLLRAGIATRNIRSYALIGFDSDPGEAWRRGEFIQNHHGIKVAPMWFHRLDSIKVNQVTDEQKALEWTDFERRRIMQWFYKHKKAVRGVE